jgi:hypothetical protein
METPPDRRILGTNEKNRSFTISTRYTSFIDKLNMLPNREFFAPRQVILTQIRKEING